MVYGNCREHCGIPGLCLDEMLLERKFLLAKISTHLSRTRRSWNQKSYKIEGEDSRIWFSAFSWRI